MHKNCTEIELFTSISKLLTSKFELSAETRIYEIKVYAQLETNVQLPESGFQKLANK